MVYLVAHYGECQGLMGYKLTTRTAGADKHNVAMGDKDLLPALPHIHIYYTYMPWALRPPYSSV